MQIYLICLGDEQKSYSDWCVYYCVLLSMNGEDKAWRFNYEIAAKSVRAQMPTNVCYYTIKENVQKPELDI